MDYYNEAKIIYYKWVELDSGINDNEFLEKYPIWNDVFLLWTKMPPCETDEELIEQIKQCLIFCRTKLGRALS